MIKWDEKVDYVLAVQNTSVEKDLWILDSGSSRHLVNDVDLLENADDFVSECVAVDGGELCISKRGTAMICVTVMGWPVKVRLTRVYFAKNLEKNILSYNLLEAKGYGISYRDQHRVIAGMNGGPAVLMWKFRAMFSLFVY